MEYESLRRTPPRHDPTAAVARPKIWAEGGQRPPFDLRASGRASLHFSRTGVAPIHAWAARLTRRVAVNVKNGAGRIPEARLGRLARFVPSHLRVAGWIKTVADILSHASASADPDVWRGNALVVEIAPHLWAVKTTPPMAEMVALSPRVVAVADPVSDLPPMSAPAVAAEDIPPPPHDPLAAIRDDLEGRVSYTQTSSAPATPPPPTGTTGTMAIQIAGYATGWLTVIIALPYGVVRAAWTFVTGTDLRRIGAQD